MELLIFLILVAVFYCIKYLLVFLAAPFVLTSDAIHKHSQTGRAEAIGEMNSDDYVALICDMLRQDGFSNVIRDPRDMAVIFATKNNKRYMWVCFKQRGGEITTTSINFVCRKAAQNQIDVAAVFYSMDITKAAIDYARNLHIQLFTDYDLAGFLKEVKKKKYVAEIPEFAKTYSSADEPVKEITANEKDDDDSEEYVSFITKTDEIPETIAYTGTGDSVIDIETPEGGWVLYAKGNSAREHFSIVGYSKKNKYTELFVNTDKPYEGITFDYEQKTAYLEINATGDWIIEIRSIQNCDVVDSSETYSFFGDRVLLLGEVCRRATVKANDKKVHFSIVTYVMKDNAFNYGDLLINTSKKYTGTVMMKEIPTVLVVEAEGEWDISLK